MAILSPAAASAPPATAGEAESSLTATPRLDPPIERPAAAVTDEARRGVLAVLSAQEEALRRADPALYLATMAAPVRQLVPGPAPVAPGVAGLPAVRVMAALFGGDSGRGAAAPVQTPGPAEALPPVQTPAPPEAQPEASPPVEAPPPAPVPTYASVSPVFVCPGPDGVVEALARHIIVFPEDTGSGRLFEVVALERMRRGEDGRWLVFDWFVTDERLAGLAWPAWVEGRVNLEPLAGRLEAEVTYTLYPGFPAPDGAVLFDLAETFEVVAVRGAAGDLPWNRRGWRVSVETGRPEPAAGATVLTIVYRGGLGAPDVRNFETLGAQGAYLRPETGWYPRPLGGGPLRGTLTVTLPGWWAAVSSGRLIGLDPPGDTRSYTWGLETPAEVYLAAGPYHVAWRETAAGVVARAFFYPREAAWSTEYLLEAERILAFFSERVAPFPYPNLSLVEVKRFSYSGLAARSLVLLDQDEIGGPRLPAGSRDLLAHEIAHQWWGEMVPLWHRTADWFLWEGLATYSEALYAESVGGPEESARRMLECAEDYARSAAGRENWSISEANVRTEKWQEAFIYDKGAWVFHMLRTLVGEEPFFRLLSSYLSLFTGRQPSTSDLAALVTSQTGDDPYLAGFFDRWVNGADTVDLTVTGVSVRRAEGSGLLLSFTVADLGSGDFPRAKVCVIFRDGGSETVIVTPGVGTTLETSRAVRWLEADPDREVLDLRRGNNLFRLVGGVAVREAALRSAGLALGAAGVAAAFAWLAWRARRWLRRARQ